MHTGVQNLRGAADCRGANFCKLFWEPPQPRKNLKGGGLARKARKCGQESVRFAASNLLSGEIHTDWDPGPTGRPGSARAGWRSVSAVCTAPKRPRVASTAPVPLRALPDTDEVGCSWPGTRRPRAALAPRLQRRHRWASAEAAAGRSLESCGSGGAGGPARMTCSRRVAVRSEFEGSGRASGACGRGLHRPRTSPPLERPAERCGPRAGAASRPIRAEA